MRRTGVTDQADTPVQDPIPAGGPETRTQIRGSGLLVFGRLGAVVVNLVTQVLVVRYLSTTDFGALAYALSLVALVESAITLGLDRAIPRFLPLYEERREYGAFFGTLALVGSTIIGLGAAAVLFVYLVHGWLAGTLVNDPTAVSLLLIVILLAPIQALDALLTDFFAVFAGARAIFVRRYVLAPGLRLAIVLIVLGGGFGVDVLAAGYVAGAALGIVLYLGLIPRVLRARGLLAQLRPRQLSFRLREIVGYTAPLLTTDLVLVFMTAFVSLLLGYTHGVEAVGSLRAIDSAARTNLIVASSFSLLFVPVATRFFARGDHAAVKDLYWQTTAWMAVLSFPFFALTFGLAEPLTVFLYGEAYRDSAIFLAIIALGRYIDSAFGANGLTLRVYGRMRVLVVVNVAAAGFHLVAALVLVPILGALGAAIAVATTFVAYNLAKQAALARYTNVTLLETSYVPLYASIAVAILVLAGVQWLIAPPVVAGLGLAALASLVVLAVGRRLLRMRQTFPELMRVPGARLLLGD